MLIPAPSFRLQQSHGTKRPSQDGEEDLRFSFLWTPANRRDCSSDLNRLGLRPILTNGAGPAATSEESLEEAYSLLVPTGRHLHVDETPRSHQSNTSFFGPYVLLLCRCAERRLTTFLTIALPRDRMIYPIFWNTQSSIHKSVKQRDDLRVMLRVRT